MNEYEWTCIVYKHFLSVYFCLFSTYSLVLLVAHMLGIVFSLLLLLPLPFGHCGEDNQKGKEFKVLLDILDDVIDVIK